MAGDFFIESDLYLLNEDAMLSGVIWTDFVFSSKDQLDYGLRGPVAGWSAIRLEYTDARHLDLGLVALPRDLLI